MRLSITKEYGEFEKASLEVLNNHTPIKKKIVYAPYMTKTLRKAIARRSNLENIYLEDRNPENKMVYRKQKNYFSQLYKFEEYYRQKVLENNETFSD